MARLPGDLGNLEKSENLKTTKIKNLTLKTPKSCRFQGSDPKLDGGVPMVTLCELL